MAPGSQPRSNARWRGVDVDLFSSRTTCAPTCVRPHVGTTDVHLVIGLSLTDASVQAYRTLERNHNDAGFAQSEPSVRWTRDVDGITVLVEFLCETNEVAGRIFRPELLSYSV